MKTGLKIYEVFKEAALGWNQSDALIHAAAIAFYTIFSMAPLIAFTVAVTSLVVSQQDVEPLILRFVTELVGPPLGPQLAEYLAEYIQSSSRAVPSGVAAFISLLFFLFSASMVFAQLQKSLNSMWGLKPAASSVRLSAVVWLRSRLTGILAAAAFSLSLLAFTAADILRVAIPEKFLLPVLESAGNILPFLHYFLSPLVFWFIFMLVFKIFPMAKICWRDVWFGSGVTAFLFWLGNWAFDLYLRYFWRGTFYGKAGTLVIFLLWIYYSNALFLFGAKLTQAYAKAVCRPIIPHKEMTLR